MAKTIITVFQENIPLPPRVYPSKVFPRRATWELLPFGVPLIDFFTISILDVGAGSLAITIR